MTERDLLQTLFNDITSFLLDNVADDQAWEDTFPELDALRGQIGDLIFAIMKDTP